MKQQFDGTKKTSLAPRHFNGKYVHNQVKDINITFGEKSTNLGEKSTIIGKRKRTVENDDKKRWIYLDVRHSIDAMHLKKNVCESLLGTLMNNRNKTKDHERARADLEDLDIRPELYPDGNSAQLPTSCINLSKEEKKQCCIAPQFLMVMR